MVCHSFGQQGGKPLTTPIKRPDFDYRASTFLSLPVMVCHSFGQQGGKPLTTPIKRPDFDYRASTFLSLPVMVCHRLNEGVPYTQTAPAVSLMPL